MTDRRPPGDRWLSCFDCRQEWDDTGALGYFKVFAECPECGGQVGKVYQPTPEEAHQYARMRRELTND